MISPSIRTLLILAAVAWMQPAPAAGEPVVLGGGVTAGDTVPVKALLIDPEQYVGRTVVVEGVITAIDSNDEGLVRISGPDGVRSVNLELPAAGFRMPDGSVGRRILAEGEVVRVEPGRGKVGYVIQVTGVILG